MHATTRFLTICGELALILLVVHLFDIESRRHFFPLLCIAAGGFVIHAWLPPRLRPAFFCLLSLGSILFILGWPNGAWVIGLGGGLVALCYLPVSGVIRAALVLAVFLALVVFRMGSLAPFWPVLGSMIMFRLFLFLYDTRHDNTRPGFFETAGYFFCLPNVCFTFFPVIDFKTWRQTYRPDDAYPVYQTGVAWIVRGITHLLAYRFIKYNLLPSPFDLQGPGDVLLFLATNYALYLKVSGHFHIITGILHLFGFDLPTTHHNYFLASSFTDIWRRINIYWKDFMMRVFFFPAFFKLRGLGTPAAVAVAALWVFLATWFLHSYQVFWVFDDFPLRLHDASLWLIVGVLVAFNLQRDLNRQATGARPAGSDSRSPAAAALHALQVAGMFLLVSVFWASWTMPGFFTQLPTLVGGAPAVVPMLGWMAALVVGVVLVGVIVQQARDWSRRRGWLPAELSFGHSAVAQAGVLGLLGVACSPQLAAMLPEPAADTLAALRRESLTPAEAAQLVQGYYEEVTAPRVQAGALLASLEGIRPPDRGPRYIHLTDPTDDLLEYELKANWAGDVEGRRLTTNRHRMRDRADLTQHKPPGTRRIALVGSSIVMGYGVADDEVFARLLEESLNAERPAGAPRYQLLNFGAGLSAPTHRRTVIERKVFAFEPDGLFYVAHQDEFNESARHLASILKGGNAVPYPAMRAAVEKAGITPDMGVGEIEFRLRPRVRDLILGLYQEIVAECHQRGIVPVLVYLPVPGVEGGQVKSHVISLATEAGFKSLDLSGWSEGRAVEDIMLSPGDHHPNALGHRLLAEHLAARLREQPEALPR
jgi:hypothetical protein